MPQLFRAHELAFRTQYAELKERTLSEGELLPGTPGSLVLRKGTGYAYWYRVYYAVPGKQTETLVCKDGDVEGEHRMRERMEFASWAAQQVSKLRLLGFQVADKTTARVLIELHNRGGFGSGLTLVGTLAYMAWLNELGGIAVTARTQDVDLGRRVRLGVDMPFMDTLTATGLPFAAVPGLPPKVPPTTVKLPGAQGLRVDMLAPGSTLGRVLRLPELSWSAQTVPHFDYLLDQPVASAMLAGNHCVPIRLPQAGRFVWHKFYSSTRRTSFPEKAEKDRLQAMTLAAILADTDDTLLTTAYRDAPGALKTALRPKLRQWIGDLERYPSLQELMRQFQ